MFIFSSVSGDDEGKVKFLSNFRSTGYIKFIIRFENGRKLFDVVIGFSNWKIASLITPSLSTINQPGELMGQKAFELFYSELQQLKKGDKVDRQIIELDTDLIVRSST